jgi:uncharacterized protein YebE (UPF0316 family)
MAEIQHHSSDAIAFRNGKRISLSEDLQRLEKEVNMHNTTVLRRSHVGIAVGTAVVVAIIVIIICMSVDYTTHLGWVKSLGIALGSGIGTGVVVALLLSQKMAARYVKRNSISTDLIQ